MVKARIAYEGTISRLIKHIEIVKSLEGFLPMALPSKVIALLLNFRPIPRDLSKKLNQGISIRNFAHRYV
jgi:hypothetical protein